jgi:predicted esterase
LRPPSPPQRGSTEPRRVAEDPPAIEAGALASGSVTIDGIQIDYVAIAPEGFEVGDEAPVLFALPPGGQTLSLTTSFASDTYLVEALARGWVVVSPAAPNGDLLFRGSEALVPGLLDWIETWVAPEDGRFHISGVSNGSISSFRIAGSQPERFASVTVYPGFASSEDDQAALAGLVDIPIRLYVGSLDTSWVAPAESVAATLESLGGDVVLDIRDGEGHIMTSLSDGQDIFNGLNSFR